MRLSRLRGISSRWRRFGVPGLSWWFAHRKRPTNDPGKPLLNSVKESLALVEHEIWMQRNAFWWTQLPIVFPVLASSVYISWSHSSGWLDALALATAFLFALFAGILYFLYCIGQRTIRLQYDPQRQELLTLLASLRDETTSEVGGEYPLLMSAKCAKFSRWRLFVGIVGFVAILLIVIAVLILAARQIHDAGEASLREPKFDDVSAFGESDTSRIDAWLQEQVEVAKYPSLSVAVVRDGEIIYQRAFGFEDIKTSKKATLQTHYHVASVTKAFTASLAVILHERGVVDLDQPVVKYLPEGVSIGTTPEVGATMTLRQLASHTSGLPRGVPGRVQSVEGWYQLEPQLLYDHLANVTLDFDPGTDEEYSNLGFGLLGHALERAADKPFDQLLQGMICEPLQLKRTAIQVDDQLHSATGYSGSGWRFERTHSFRERLRAFRRSGHLGRGPGEIPGSPDEAGSIFQRNA